MIDIYSKFNSLTDARFKIGKQKLSATAAGVTILNAQDSGGKVSGLHTE